MYDQIIDLAAVTDSSSVLISRNGQTLVDWRKADDHQRIAIMSVTKLVVGIAVALVFAEEVDVLDTPLAARWIPEWRPEKSQITLRHVLTHTTGIDAPPPPEIYAMPNVVRGALEASVVSPPGRFAYNNLVINLAGEIVRRHTGVALHEWIDRHLFAPLGITDWGWRLDSAGNPHCFADLALRADDLLKLGTLLVNEAGVEGVVLSESWRRAIEPAPPREVGVTSFARYAWIRYELTPPIVGRWREAGIPDDLVDPLLTLIGTVLEEDDYLSNVQSILGRDGYIRLMQLRNASGLPLAQPTAGPRIGYGHDGDQGQHLVVFANGCVAVRLRAWEPDPAPGTAW